MASYKNCKKIVKRYEKKISFKKGGKPLKAWKSSQKSKVLKEDSE